MNCTFIYLNLFVFICRPKQNKELVELVELDLEKLTDSIQKELIEMKIENKLPL